MKQIFMYKHIPDKKYPDMKVPCISTINYEHYT